MGRIYHFPKVRIMLIFLTMLLFFHLWFHFWEDAVRESAKLFSFSSTFESLCHLQIILLPRGLMLKILGLCRMSFLTISSVHLRISQCWASFTSKKNKELPAFFFKVSTVSLCHWLHLFSWLLMFSHSYYSILTFFHSC